MNFPFSWCTKKDNVEFSGSLLQVTNSGLYINFHRQINVLTYGPDFCYFPLYLSLFFPCIYIAASREVSVPPANSILLVKTALQTSDAAGVEMIMILGLEGNLQRLFIHIQGKVAG